MTVVTEKFSRGGEPGSVAELLTFLKASPQFGPTLMHERAIPGAAADPRQPERPWPPEIAAILRGIGIADLYSHQAEAIDQIRSGNGVITSTPTASGKSLVYSLPVIERLLADPGAHALYLFPLKALAQDQLKSLDRMLAFLPEALRPRAAIYDGDTPPPVRRRLREKPPGILISNPDLLHLSLLGYHASWASFLAGLRLVVIDEVHTYRGVLGSHMAWVLRRLKRLCDFYGSRPVFVLSSATVGNPGELARLLTGEDLAVVTRSGAPAGRRFFVFVNPPENAAREACALLEESAIRGLRAIVYTQSRKMTELIALWTEKRSEALRGRIAAYRSGFLPEDRREIEARLADGSLVGVVATSALELGIDIGSLDVCILVGYPGSIMATWQRGGRVGRRQGDSLVLLVAQEDALDQHFMRHPEDFFARPVEAAVLNPANRSILEKHLVCAAAELPLTRGETILADRSAREATEALAGRGALLLAADGSCWHTNRKYPHREVDLRGSGEKYAIRHSGSGAPLGEIDGFRCFRECHPGAVYLHMGETWLVDGLDLERREVAVRRARVGYFTRAMAEKQTEILTVDAVKSVRGFRVSLGTLRVTSRVTSYQKRLLKGQRLIGVVPLDLPPHVMVTEGLWVHVPGALQRSMEEQRLHFMGAIHAMEHAAIGLFPLLVLCDRNDVGGISTPHHPQAGGAAVFIYDGYSGGIGLCRQAFDRVEELLARTLETVEACPCETGCPSCVHSPKCGSGNRPIDKAAARELLRGLLSGGAIQASVVEEPGSAPPAVGHGDGIIPSHYCVFDLETKRSADEVGGWHKAGRMGMSLGVVYDSLVDRFVTYTESQVGRLVEHLRRVDLVVGFNCRKFDYAVLSGYGVFHLHALPTLDLLEVVSHRLGYRLSLDKLAHDTLGVRKSATGLQALAWFREGNLTALEEYCRKDVAITRDLFLHAMREGHLLFRNKAGHLVRCPFSWPEAK